MIRGWLFARPPSVDLPGICEGLQRCLSIRTSQSTNSNPTSPYYQPNWDIQDKGGCKQQLDHAIKFNIDAQHENVVWRVVAP